MGLEENREAYSEGVRNLGLCERTQIPPHRVLRTLCGDERLSGSRRHAHAETAPSYTRSAGSGQELCHGFQQAGRFLLRYHQPQDKEVDRPADGIGTLYTVGIYPGLCVMFYSLSSSPQQTHTLPVAGCPGRNFALFIYKETKQRFTLHSGSCAGARPAGCLGSHTGRF